MAEHRLFDDVRRWVRHLPLAARLLRPRALRRSLALLPAVTGPRGRPVAVRIPGLASPLELRARTSDVLVAVQILLLDELDVDGVRTPAVVVDAGANIGLSAITLAARWPEATVVCLEVDDDNLELLRRNTRSWPRIRVVPKGLWRRAARLRVENAAAASWAFRVVEDDAGPIPGIGVAELLAELGEERIGLMKVDIEGAEQEVFEGDAGWLARVDALLVELHEDLRPGSSEGVRRKLRDAGFALRASGEYVVATRPGP